MERISISEIVKATNGRLINTENGRVCVNGVSTDSRGDLAGKLFIAIRGEKFDGHNYIGEVFEKGAVCALSETEIQGDKPVILVADTKKALRDLAEYYKSLFCIPVVAITGSAGKTTTKDLIHSVLSVKYKALKNQGNLNNEMGLPQTVFQLDGTYAAAVLEMGMNSFGEIRNLSKIARPDIAVITNIGQAHIENLGSREGIFKAKCEIFEYMKSGGRIVINADDDMLIRVKEDKGKNVITYGFTEDCDYYPADIEENGLEGSKFTVNSPNGKYTVKIPVPGKHMIYNALAAAAVGEALNLTSGEIAAGMMDYKPSAMRMDIFKTPGGIAVINDAYNANPASMRAAIDVLSLAKGEGRKVCILGDMLELGEFSREAHYETGEYAGERGVDLLICVGREAKHIIDGALYRNSRIEAACFGDKKSLFDSGIIGGMTKPGDTVLIKASRGMGFEEIVKNIT